MNTYLSSVTITEQQKHLLRLMLPMFLAVVFGYSCNLFDYFWVKLLPGSEYAAIVALINGSIVAYLYIFSRDYECVFTAIYSKSAKEEQPFILKQGLILGFFGALVITALLIFFSKEILSFLSHGHLGGHRVRLYFSLIVVSYPISILSVVFSSFLRSHNDTKRPALLEVSSLVINVLLDPIFIFGIYGYGHFGFLGLGISIIITKCIYLLGIIYLASKYGCWNLLQKGLYTLNFAVQKRILRIWIPAICTSFLVFGAYLFLYALFSYYGNSVIAAYGLWLEILALGYILLKCVGTVFLISAGQAIKKSESVGTICNSIYFIAGILVTFVSLVYYLLGYFAPSILLKDPQAAHLFSIMLLSSPVFLMGYILRLIMGNLFNLLERPIYIFFINVLLGWLITVVPIYYTIKEHVGFMRVFYLLVIINCLRICVYITVIELLKRKFCVISSCSTNPVTILAK